MQGWGQAGFCSGGGRRIKISFWDWIKGPATRRIVSESLSPSRFGFGGGGGENTL